MKLYNVLIFLLVFISASAQQYDAHWLCGWGPYNTRDTLQGGVKIRFQGGNRTIQRENRPITLGVGNTVISDYNGNLSFLTNGLYIADRFGNKMRGGDSLNYGNGGVWNEYRLRGGSGLPRGFVTLPKPGSDSLYYLFHRNLQQRFGLYEFWDELMYSVIDMSRNSGLGEVIAKNQFICYDTLGWSPSACKHANGRDWWIAWKTTTSIGKVILQELTPQGVSSPRTVSIGGPPEPSLYGSYAIFTPDGSKYINYDIKRGLFVYDFDRCDGTFNFTKSYNPPDSFDTFITSISASPNSRFLYLCYGWWLLQFDLSQPTLEPDTVLVCDRAQIPPMYWSTSFNQSQLMPDGKIYITPQQSTYLHVIHAPDSAGLACRAEQRAITLPVYNNVTIPYFPNYRLGPLRGSGCDTLLSGVGASMTPTPKGGIQVYPNPTGGPVHLELEDNLLLMQVLVYDALGREVSAVVDIQARQVDLSGLPNGVYFLELRAFLNEGNEGVKRAKIIKN